MGEQTILVCGGTGRIGRLLVSRLIAMNRPVRVLARDPARAAGMLPAAAHIVGGDLRESASLVAAAEGCARVIFVAGPSGQAERGASSQIEFEAVRTLAITCANAPEFKRFVLFSSAGVTQPEHPHNCTFGSMLKWKLLGEQALRAADLPHVIVRGLGLRDRPTGQAGVRMVEGDRIAFGEDIAREDVALFLADVCLPEVATGFAPGFARDSLAGAVIEIFNDASVAGGQWLHGAGRLTTGQEQAA